MKRNYVLSFFFLSFLSLPASSRSTYINHFHPRTLSPRTSKIRREREREKKARTGMKEWEERRAGKGWKKENAKQGGSLYASRCRSTSIVSSQGRAVCDTWGFARLPPFSLSLKFFFFFFIFEQLSLPIPPFLSNRFLSTFFFFFLTNCNWWKENETKSLSLSLTRISCRAFDNANFI